MNCAVWKREQFGTAISERYAQHRNANSSLRASVKGDLPRAIHTYEYPVSADGRTSTATTVEASHSVHALPRGVMARRCHIGNSAGRTEEAVGPPPGVAEVGTLRSGLTMLFAVARMGVAVAAPQ